MLPSNSNDNVICNLETKFKQFGVYHLTIEDNKCTLETLKDPVNIYFRKPSKAEIS